MAVVLDDGVSDCKKHIDNRCNSSSAAVVLAILSKALAGTE